METTQNTQVQKSEQNDDATAAAHRAAREAQRGVKVRAYTPPIDVFEGPDAIVVHVDVPGVSKEDVTLRLEKSELWLHATRRESLHGPLEYRRTLALPPEIDGEAIAADLDKGVLVLTLPRKANAKPRTIAIRG